MIQTLGHYRILDKIGEGGMGVVFRARDEQLERDVALKVLPSGVLSDEASRRQFRTEALALAKLSHPNIETVFEFNSQDGIDFLALELIPGISLKDKVKNGPLPEKEVLRLGIQLAEGLAAAHGRGVIHRDLKPANVFVTGDGRLKILDFGLAKLARMELGSEATESFTSDHSTISGTVPYMSPEQLSALPLDSRTDIYSAGVVLYEMAVGLRPFSGLQGARLIGAILHQTPPSPTSLNPRLSPGLESVIAKTIEKDPGQRYQSAGELQAALAGISAASSGVIDPVLPRRTKRSPWLSKPAILSAVFLVVVVAFASLAALNVMGLRDRLLAWRSVSTSGAIRAPLAPARKSIAVLKLTNAGGAEQAALATELGEVLTNQLEAGGNLRMIPEESVAEMQIDLTLPNASSYSPATLHKIRQNLNTDYVAVGSYMPLEHGQIRIDLTVEDTSTGEIVDSVSATGNSPPDLAVRAAAEMRAKLGVASVSAAEASEVKETLSKNPEAERLYSAGLAKMRSFDTLAGRSLLQEAVKLDPQFALAHSALARAWKDLGYDHEAEMEAKEAFDLSGALPRENRLLVQGQYHEMEGEWDKSIETYQSLFTFFPDNIEYGLLLTEAEISAGRGKDALATVDSLRKLPPPSGEDVRIDIVAARASSSLGDFKQSQSLATAAAEKARANGAKLLVARALLWAASADEKLGEIKEATRAQEQASAIYESAGDRNSVARTLEVEGNVFADQGELEKAIESYKNELAIASEVGNEKAEASALNNLGLVIEQQGDYSTAEQYYGQAITAFRTIGDRANTAMTLLNLGERLQDDGNLSQSQSTYKQVLSLSREVGDKKGEGNGLTTLATVLDAEGKLTAAKATLDQAIALDLQSGNKVPSADKLVAMGDVLQHSGQLTAAESTYNQALQVAKETSDTSNAAWAYFGLGSVSLLEADLPAAKQNYQQALAIRTQIGEKETAAMTRVAIASTAIEEGHPGNALPDLVQIRDALLKENRTSDSLFVTLRIIDALLAQQKLDDARHEMETADSLAANNQNSALRMDLNLQKARLKIASGNPSAAVPILKRVLSEGKRTGFLRYQFEARLAMDDAAIKSGRGAQARADLNKLQLEATAKRFVLVSRTAVALVSNLRT